MDLDQKFNSTLFSVSSVDRRETVKDESSEKFSIALPFAREFSEVDAVQVLSVHLPNSAYNIKDGTWHFDFSYNADTSVGNGQGWTITPIEGAVPAGQYNYEELLEALANSYNTAVASLPEVPDMVLSSSTVDLLTYKTTLSFQTKANFTMPAFGAMFISVGHESDPATLKDENEVLHHLGWYDTVNTIFDPVGTFQSNTITSSTSDILTLSSPYLVDLSGPKELHIYCPELTSNLPGLKPLLVSVPISAEFGEIVNYHPSGDRCFIHEYRTARSLSELSFSIHEVTGREVHDLGNQEWGLLLKIWYSQ